MRFSLIARLFTLIGASQAFAQAPNHTLDCQTGVASCSNTYPVGKDAGAQYIKLLRIDGSTIHKDNVQTNDPNVTCNFYHSSTLSDRTYECNQKSQKPGYDIKAHLACK